MEGIPRHVEEAQINLRFHHNIVACSVAIWSALAISRDTGIYQGRIEFRYRLKVHGVFLERAGKIVLDKDITSLGELV